MTTSVLRALVAAAPLLAVPLRASAQEVHAGAQGYVFETEVLERGGDGVIRLANGAVLLATPALAGARAGSYAVVVPLRSGCRVWITDIGLSRCSLVQEVPDDAPKTDVVLVWVERVIDAGATILLTGGSVYAVGDQAEFTNTWRPGEAVLIQDSRLVHLDYGAAIVHVTRTR